MASRAYYEWTLNYVHASGAFSLPRQRSFLPFALRKLPEAFAPTVAKSWYPHYFNTRANLDYVGQIPDITYGFDEISGSERSEFLRWYKGQKDSVFDNKRVLEAYCQDDVSVERSTLRVEV